MAQVGRASFENKVERSEPIVIFLTDGEPNVEMSDPNEIIKTVDQMNKNKYQVMRTNCTSVTNWEIHLQLHILK